VIISFLRLCQVFNYSSVRRLFHPLSTKGNYGHF